MAFALQSCVLPPPPPVQTGTSTPLAVDRQKVIPLTAGVVRLQRGIMVDFDVEGAIVHPSTGESVYVSWWLDFDPTNPLKTARIADGKAHLELDGCSAPLSGPDARTVQLEALITTADRLITDDLFDDPRVGPNGEPVLVVQWTILIAAGEVCP
jgi:hypothetical protein